MNKWQSKQYHAPITSFPYWRHHSHSGWPHYRMGLPHPHTGWPHSHTRYMHSHSSCTSDDNTACHFLHCRVRPLKEAQRNQNAVLAHFLTSLNKHGQGTSCVWFKLWLLAWDFFKWICKTKQSRNIVTCSLSSKSLPLYRNTVSAGLKARPQGKAQRRGYKNITIWSEVVDL